MKTMITILLMLLASAAQAQTVTYVEAGKPLNAAADHPGTAVTGYQLYVDDVKSGPEAPASARGSDGVVRVVIPSLPPGAHKLELSAIYAWGQEAKSPPLNVTAVTASPPGVLRIPLSVNVMLQQQ